MTQLVAYRDGVALHQLEEPDVERPCTVCGVPGAMWEVVLPGAHVRGFPEAYCGGHEAEARAEFVSIAGDDRRG